MSGHTGTGRMDTGHIDTVHVNGGILHYEIIGEGEPLVLAHAGVADLSMWNAQMSAFAAHNRVLRYDMRGFGASDDAASTFSHHDDLNDLLTQLDIDRAHFVGLSNGGMVVTDFALAFPERVASLVLASPALSGHDFSGEPPQAIYALMAALEAGNLDAASDVATRIWADGPHRTPDAVNPAVRDHLRAMSRRALENQLPGAMQPAPLEPPAAGRLSEITAPTLIVLGDKDDPSILEIGEILHASIAGSEQAIIENAAHMLNMERPEAFNILVLDFLERHR